jgi:dienelactone hydrolase
MAAAAIVGMVVAACSGKTTQAGGLELILNAQGLRAGADFDSVQVLVEKQTSAGPPVIWSTLADVKHLVPVEIGLPTTFSIEAGSANDEARISVTALLGVKPVVRRVVQLQVPTNRVAELLMVLSQSCAGKVDACGQESCQPSTGACGSNQINASDLPDYRSGDESNPAIVNGDASAPDGTAGGEAGGAADGGAPDATASGGDAEGLGPDAATDSGPVTMVDGGGDDGGDSGLPSPSCPGGHLHGPAPTTLSGAAMGPFTVQSYAADSTVRSTLAYDVTSAHIYYPTNAVGPLSGISMVPGFTSSVSVMSKWATLLASHGFIAMTIGTSNPTTGAPDTSVQPPVRAAALADALTTIRGENTRAGSPLAGKVDTARLGFLGWSMGGGGALEAAKANPQLAMVIALNTWNGAAVDAGGPTYTNDALPTLLIGGSSDTLASPAPSSIYTSIPMAVPKVLYVVNAGTATMGNDPANSSGNVGRFGVAWAKVFLDCDDRYRQFLTQPSDAADFRSSIP